MSLTKVRPFFRNRLLGLGFLEHEDVFNRENIPKTVIDKSFHALIQSFDGGPINHTHQDVVVGVLVTVVFKGFRDVSETMDRAILEVECIIKDVCNIAVRTSDLLNVVFSGADFSALNLENDNSVLVELSFDAQVILNVENN
jgi:hypothetical protein